MAKIMVPDEKFAQGLEWLRQAVRQPGAWEKFEAAGWHVTPVHFYQPIPDLRKLPRDAFTRVSTMPGIEMRLDEQLALVTSLVRARHAEFESFPASAPADGPPGYYRSNGYFNHLDGFLLYALLRERKPRRVLELGSGFSTLLTAEAMRRNRAEGHAGSVDAFDPYPRAGLGLEALEGVGFQPLFAQDVPLAEFEALAAGDVLFVDSSHVAKIGSDVTRLVLEVFPRLRPGVWLHVHDIFWPHDYPESWVRGQKRFWNEQYLLQAFLACNPSFAVRWCARYAHYHAAGELQKLIPGYGAAEKGPGGSLWLERVA
jgi:hypothetical protein